MVQYQRDRGNMGGIYRTSDQCERAAPRTGKKEKNVIARAKTALAISPDVFGQPAALRNV